MRAYKCDICGKLYEYYDNFNTLGLYVRILDGSIHGEIKMHDCCPECMDSVQDLIETLRRAGKKEE